MLKITEQAVEELEIDPRTPSSSSCLNHKAILPSAYGKQGKQDGQCAEDIFMILMREREITLCFKILFHLKVCR